MIPFAALINRRFVGLMKLILRALFSEDVLKNPKALWSSYDGTHLLYATFNDSEVGILNFPWFKTESGLAANKAANRAPSFPASKTVRYPTVGWMTF